MDRNSSPYSLNFLSFLDPLIFPLFNLQVAVHPLARLKTTPTSRHPYARRDIPGLPRIPPPGRRCRLPGVPRHTAGRGGTAPPARMRKTDNRGMPRRAYRLRKARRPSGPASRKPLIAGARAAAPVAKIEVRWPERTVMNCLKVYGSPLSQDMRLHTKSPTMH
jgi:hypothetical protein